MNNIEERLKLYQRLGELTEEEDLQFFEMELEDRFGPIPPSVAALLYSVRIKWLAKHIGFQKLIIKMGKFIGHFAAENNSEYYQLPIFSAILGYCSATAQGSSETKGRETHLCRTKHY